MPPITRRLFAGSLAASAFAAAVGPDTGTLIVIGGGQIGPAILREFVSAAGGPDAPVVYVPTAGDADGYPADYKGPAFLREAGFSDVHVVHTRDRSQADTPEFTAPVERARAVFFGGGRQWRLVDSYLGTRCQRAFAGVLERGGVIGGTSAGATIQGSYLVRGARQGNQIMMAPGYERGFGYLRGVAIDQHLLKRGRQDDMLAVVDRHPELLGIGIDEDTALVVRGDEATVLGESKVAVYDHRHRPEPGGKRYYFLEPGERFHLAARARLAP